MSPAWKVTLDMGAKFSIDDYGLTVEQLEARYSPDGDGQHPVYTIWDWVQVVAQRSTREGYWYWLKHQLDEERDELDRDNPYNQS